MKTLPEYFIILRDATNPLWDKYIQWLYSTYSERWSGSEHAYYGYDGNCRAHYKSTEFSNNPTIITLDYWNECVNGFQLPEKWYIIPKSKEEDAVLCKYRGGGHTEGYENAALLSTKLWEFSNRVGRKYIEITFEQFKKYVLKQDNMEKRLIGYELKPKFKHMRRAVEEITNFSNSGDSEEYFTNYFKSSLNLPSGNFAKILKEAGVLDLWFEPVYEDGFKVGDYVLLSNNAHGWGSLAESVNNKMLQITKIDLKDQSDVGGRYYFGRYKTVGQEIVRKATSEEIAKAQTPNITIKGYKAEFTEDSVTFGCQTYSKEFVITLAECLRRNGFEMEIKDEILEIAEYFESL